jgi:hypothetical protein
VQPHPVSRCCARSNEPHPQRSVRSQRSQHVRKWLGCVRVLGPGCVCPLELEEVAASPYCWESDRLARSIPSYQGRVRPVCWLGWQKSSSPSRRRLKRSYQFLQTINLDDTRHTHTLLPLAVSHKVHRPRIPSHQPLRRRHLHNKCSGSIELFGLEHALVELRHA